MSEVKFVKGDIFKSEMSAIVCPVNCMGVMGAGLAKQFRDKFNNKGYQYACIRGEMSAGSVYIRQPLHVHSDTSKTLVYLATKFHWQDDSKPEYIELGLFNLIRAMNFYSIPTIAIPAIGCGCGHLPWATVEQMIKSNFIGDGQKRTVEVYQPLNL